ncbi:hypothetical protein [Streptomyces sp. 4F14]|uniref:hypothetical protein n=1 Tax=Streptomyces sp. 4F14 TaxID=3394380 RepID=UPI003A856021
MRTRAVRRAALVTAVLGVLVTGCGGSPGGSDSAEATDGATSSGLLEPWEKESPESTPTGSAGDTDDPGPSGSAKRDGTTRGTSPTGSSDLTKQKGTVGPTGDVRSSRPATSSTPDDEDDRDPPVKKCGITAPTGTQDGRRAQTVVLPPLGTHHTFPHITVPLRGCATSGLPVVYTVDRASNWNNCNLEPAENPTHVELSGTSGGCTVIASQPGDSTWAPAEAVGQQFRVGYQPVTLSWADPRADLPYPGTLAVRVGIKSPDPLEADIRMRATGSCDFGGSGTTYVRAARQTRVTATLNARDPGPGGKGGCEVSASVVSDHTVSNTIDKRTYNVIASPAPPPQ